MLKLICVAFATAHFPISQDHCSSAIDLRSKLLATATRTCLIPEKSVGLCSNSYLTAMTVLPISAATLGEN